MGGVEGAGGLRAGMSAESDCPTPPPVGQTVSLPPVLINRSSVDSQIGILWSSWCRV